MNKLFYFFLAVPVFFTSCANDDNLVIEDTTAPQIELFSPSANTVYKVGDSIKIKGRLSDNNELHEASITVMNNGGSMMNCPMHVHELKEYTFDTTYIVKASDVKNGLKLTVKAEDHDDNKNEKTLELTAE